jgi:hypothetical protein
MITLEQIRQLESKITRALELIRVLKEENGTLRRGLESAQKRMRELETLVEGFKTDQKEIESVIVRTLHNLDELEENAMTTRKAEHAAGGASAPQGASPSSPPAHAPALSEDGAAASASPASAPQASSAHGSPAAAAEGRPPKEELDIF